jgi:hypothetical protein
MFLRAVQNGKGENDLLDQVNDLPAKDEKVFVYQMEGNPGTIHIHGEKGIQGWWALARYRYLPAIDGEKFRENTIWQEWALKRMKEV